MLQSYLPVSFAFGVICKVIWLALSAKSGAEKAQFGRRGGGSCDVRQGYILYEPAIKKGRVQYAES